MHVTRDKCHKTPENFNVPLTKISVPEFGFTGNLACLPIARILARMSGQLDVSGRQAGKFYLT
jgi:hypothetical protein